MNQNSEGNAMMRGMRLLIAFTTIMATVQQRVDAGVFNPGDLFISANSSQSPIYNITGGGDFGGASAFALGGASGDRNLGQMAWSSDLSTMYTTNYFGDSVYQVDSDGNSSLYANVNRALGIVVTESGQVLVNSFSAQTVYDITDPNAISVFATLPTYARNMKQLSTGEILIAGSGGQVFDISSGTAQLYATIQNSIGTYLGDIDETSDGRVFVSGATSQKHEVHEITGGGTFADTPYATITNPSTSGTAFGLAINPLTDQMLLAPLSRNYVLDITGGGTFDETLQANRFAYNIPVTSDMALDFVPLAETDTVPEPTSLAIFGLGGLGLVAGGFRRRKRQQA
jgi:hypothetical protein